MAIRIGQFILGPNALILPFSAAFFLLLAWRRISKIEKSKPAIFATFIIIAIFTLAGAWLHAATLPANHAYKMQFGLLGGFWGALTGTALTAAIQRKTILNRTDAIVPALLISGAIARVGCLFAGCCNGRIYPIFESFQPFRHWPLFDIAALLLTAITISRTETIPSSKPGCITAQFLALYGSLRFVLEFARDVPKTFGPFSPTQALIIIQIVIGAAILLKITHIKNHSA
jgi:phosphatidylglycerol:prolipoprotein diacylglycerol transferase